MTNDFKTVARTVFAEALKEMPTDPEAIIVAVIGADGVRLSGFGEHEDSLHTIVAICHEVIEKTAGATCPHCQPIGVACQGIVEVVKKVFDVLNDGPGEVLH